MTTLWFNPKCSKCRQAQALLEERGVKPTLRRYLDEAPTQPELEKLLERLGAPAQAILRAGEPETPALESASREQIIAAIVANPRLLVRPILEVGERAVIARPPERVLELVSPRSS